MDQQKAELSIDTLEQIEAVCVDFEARCQEGLESASPEDFLERVDGREARSQLVIELILLKADYQLRAGDWPDRAEYLRTLPSLADAIESAFSRIVGRVKSEESTPNLGPRYQVRDLLGVGGMGRVYRAHDQKLDRFVAIKVLRGRRGSLGTRFENEIRLVASLVHPNIVGLFDLVTHRDTDFAVMELIEGDTLRRRLEHGRGEPLPRDLVVDWGLGVARALKAAHRLGIVHRDIKPENVMVTDDGDVKVLDFGLALRELLPTDQRLTSDSTVVGTIPYMSPEQAAGAEVSRATDIFSLGTTLLELLSGVNPFGGKTAAETFHKIINQPLADLCDPMVVPPAIWEVLRKMAAKEAAERPTAAAVIELLSAAQTGTRPHQGAGISTSIPTSIPTATPTNLPRRSKSLLGRDAELLSLHERLQHAALTTVIGAGGAGKTALAYQAARERLPEYPGGVWVCEFASLSPGGDVTQSLAAALDSTEGAVAGLDEIVERLKDRRTLVLLDNCEHVIDEAAHLASELLNRLPMLSILATSRRPLELDEEHTCFIDGLDCEREDSDAARLFIRCCETRAGYEHATEDAATISSIVKRLEGLPLLIELAAPKLKSMSLSELLSSLDDQLTTLRKPRGPNDRQATVGQTIEWSYSLLAPEQQQRLLALSTFRASFTLDDAEAIADEPNPKQWLSGLIDQSLVARVRADGESRYRLLEPIRQFCESRLDANIQEALDRRHAFFILEKIRVIGIRMHGPNEVEATRELNYSWADLRAATAWGRRNRVAEVAIDSITHLGWMIMLHSRVEAFRWLELAEDAMPESIDDRTQAIATIGLGHWLAGNQEAAQRYADRSNALNENAYAMVVAYAVSYVEKRFDESVEQFRRARPLAERDGETQFQMFLSLPMDVLPRGIADPSNPEIDELLEVSRTTMLDLRWPSGIAWHTLLMANVAGFRGERPREATLLELTIARAEECGSLWLQTYATMLLEGSHGAGADLDMCLQHLSQLEALVEGRMAAHYAVCLRNLVLAMIECGRDELAAKCVPITNQAVGGGSLNEHHPAFPGAIAQLEGRLGNDRFAMFQAIGETMTIEDVVSACRQELDDPASTQS